jgi:hypothetical protein
MKQPYELSLKMIENIVLLDVLSDLGQHNREILPRDIKLLWNIAKRNRYEADILPVTEEEAQYFMSAANYKGMVVSQFLADFIEFLPRNCLENSHEKSPFSNTPFEYYLINHLVYFKNSIAPHHAYAEKTWEWLLEKVDFSVENHLISIPKVIIAWQSASIELYKQYSLESIRGVLGWIGYFCCYGSQEIFGYMHPAWFQTFLDQPSPRVPNAAQKGITVLLESIWYSDSDLQQQVDIFSAEGQYNLVKWFIDAGSHRLSHYQHPTWVVDLFGSQLNERQSLPPQKINKEKPLSQIKENQNDVEIHYDRGGLNLIGWPRTPIGIGEDIRVAASSLSEVNIPFVVQDGITRVPPGLTQYDCGLEKYIVDRPKYETDVVFLDAATQFRYFSVDTIKNKKIDRNVIIASPWELPFWPEKMNFVFDHVTTFWAATQYIYDAFKMYFSEKNIQLAPPAVYLSEEKIKPFSLLNIDAPFTFLTTFDGLSSINRKNPFAVVKAFKAAFPASQKEVRLIVKTMNFNSSNDALIPLIDLIKTDPRIQILNKTLSSDELSELVQSSHCFVSLHRAEGFGRNIAECMLMGRPVICSNFSGNLDFCFNNNSYLVDGELIPVKPGQYAFSENQYWFDASVEHAAVHMREVYENRAKADLVARAGQDYIRSFHSIGETGLRYKKLLSEII